MSAIDTRGVAEPVVHGRVVKHLKMQRVIVFAGGLGMPGVTTDTAAAQRAFELDAQALLVAKFGTNGIYDKDPRNNPDAQRFDELTYAELLERRLEVMDAQAVQKCREARVPIFVFDMHEENSVLRALTEQSPRFGTWVRET